MALKMSDLKNLTKDELNIKMSALKVDLYNLRYQGETGRVEKPSRIRLIRRDIARIQTALREGELKDAGSPKKTS